MNDDIRKGDGLVEAFYRTYNESDKAERLGKCQAIVTELRYFAETDSRYLGWCHLFDAIIVMGSTGDWGEAGRLFQLALDTSSDETPLLQARAQLALAVYWSQQDRWSETIRLCRLCRPVFHDLNLPVDEATALRYLSIAFSEGFFHGEFGESALDDALESGYAALAVLDAAEQIDEISSLKSMVWITVGLALAALMRWDEAIAAYRRHHDICERLGFRCRMAISLHNMGHTYHRMGGEFTDQAFDAYDRALVLYRECDYRMFEIETLADLGALHQSIGDLEAADAHFMLAIEQIEALRAGVSTEAARAGLFAIIRYVFAHAVLLKLEMNQVEAAFELTEKARSRAFLDLLAAGSSELEREMAVESMMLDEVQAALAEDVLLLSYFTTGLVEAGDRGRVQQAQRHRIPPAKTLLFAITTDACQVVDAGLSPNDLLPQQLGSVVERHFLDDRIRRILYGKLVEPVKQVLEGKRRIYIAPHGPLHYAPFPALLAGDSEPFLQEDGPALVFGPSATLLFRPQGDREVALPPCDRKDAPLLALGYNGDGDSQLRFAEEEATMIARLSGGRALVGRQEKRSELFTSAGDYRLLHFSCHGHFDPDKPMASALHLSETEQLSAAEIMTSLHLNCDLVTLSACESGLSKVRRGDELMGLVRAFMFAGAPAVVATLWRVDERSTRILMTKFYEEVLAGVDYAEALKRAQVYLRTFSWSEEENQTSENRDRRSARGAVGERLFTDPLYWAPFILIGGC